MNKVGINSLWSSGGSALGSFFSVGCPVCVPAVGAIFSSLGLGLFLNMTFLKWLTLGLLCVGLLGLYANYQKHGESNFLIVGVLASLLVFASRYIWESTLVIYASAAVLLANALLDYQHAKKKGSCCLQK